MSWPTGPSKHKIVTRKQPSNNVTKVKPKITTPAKKETPVTKTVVKETGGKTGWIVLLVIFVLLFASVSNTIWAIVMGVIIGAFCILIFTHKPSRMRVVQLFKKK